jgi:MFS family permease
MAIYYAIAIFFFLISALLLFSRPHFGDQLSDKRKKYLLGYTLASGADWLQGPYIFALYETYGLPKSDIALLFIASYLSSLFFGTFISSLADKYGRKRLCVLYGLLYSTSCLCTLINSFDVLLLGRILTGISTSILHTDFEAWMVHEHLKQPNFHECVAYTMSLSVIGNSIVGIFAGWISSYVAQHYGFTAPFITSFMVLLSCVYFITATFAENYGDPEVKFQNIYFNAVSEIKKDHRLAFLGLAQSLFGAAMYTFVFMWTPMLQESGGENYELPYTLIFVSFMFCNIIGSLLYLHLLRRTSPENITRLVYIISALALLIPFFFVSIPMLLLSFFTFQICCGINTPSIGTLKSKYVPEHTRSAVLNLIQVPERFLLVFILIKVTSFENSTIYLLSFLWLGLAAILQSQLVRGGQNVRIDDSI